MRNSVINFLKNTSRTLDRLMQGLSLNGNEAREGLVISSGRLQRTCAVKCAGVAAAAAAAAARRHGHIVTSY